MRVFVTGVNGYIGAVLAPYLLERGMTLVGLDTGYYRDGWLYSDDRHQPVSPLSTRTCDISNASTISALY